MIGKRIIENKMPIPAIKVKEILEEYSENNELVADQNYTLNHISRLPHFSVEDSYKIIEEIEDMGIKREFAVRIVDLIPKDLDDLRLIFSRKQPSKEDMEKILEILDQYFVEE